MTFLTQQAFQERIKSPWLSSTFAFRIAAGMFGWNRVNKFCASTQDMSIEDFLQQYKRKSKITHYIQENHIRRIPQTGPLIIVANHPTGIPDALVILDTVFRVRKDVKIIANELMHCFPPLSPHTIPVDPYGTREAVSKNITPLKLVFEWLNEGHCIILFPSGDVGHRNENSKEISEQPWHSTAKKILMRFEGIVLPWVIKGNNSPIFYRAARISPVMKSALLPREGLKRKKRPIHSQIGKPVWLKKCPKALFDLETIYKLLGQVAGQVPKFPFQNKRWIKRKYARPAKMLPIIAPVDRRNLEKEIVLLGYPVAEKGDLQVFSFNGTIPENLIQEIGRLREKTFREVNEGTGNAIDLDRYDPLCTHLVLWDKSKKCVAGGYRLAFGSTFPESVFENSSLKPHYYDHPKLQEILVHSVVLGRAFIAKEYQCKPFPLFLLWTAVDLLIKADKTISYVIGQTSIPATYQDHSKAFIVSFLKKHFQHPVFGEYFIPKEKFIPTDNPIITDWIAKSSKFDLKRLDILISNLEPNGEKIPILFKRYLDQGAKFLSVNLDPSFNHSLDVLLISSVTDIHYGA